MSESQRPYEQIPYPTGPEPVPEPVPEPLAAEPPVAEPAAAEPPASEPPASEAPAPATPAPETSAPESPAPESPAQPQPSPYSRDWPDGPWPESSPWAPQPPPVAEYPPLVPYPPSPQPAPYPVVGAQPAPGSDPAPTTEPAPPRNPWKWVAAGLAVLLAILVAGIIGRVTAPSPPPTAAPSPATDSDGNGGQGPHFTPEPSPGGSTFTPRPGSPPTDYSGHGNAVVHITKDAGPAIVTFQCNGCAGNTFVKTDGPESVLVSAVGNYSGRRPIDLREGSNTGTITVTATGDWQLSVASGLNTARASVGDAPLTGQGDDVVIMNGGAPTAHVTNTGGTSFIVYVVPVQSATVNLAVNSTTGEYDGVVSLSAPAVVIVQSTGSWTITPRA